MEVSEKVLNFFFLELGTFGVSTLLTLFFLVPYDQNAAKKLSKELKKKALEKGKEENNNINEDENKKDDDKGIIIEDYNRNTVNKDEALLPQDDQDDGITKINRYEVVEGEKNDYNAKFTSGVNKDKKVIAIQDTKAGVLDTNPISANISKSITQVNYSTRHT